MDEEALMRKILAGELHYAKLWLVCVALRGVSWDKMPFEQRELAFQAKDAAFNCLSIFLNSPAYRYTFSKLDSNGDHYSFTIPGLLFDMLFTTAS
jgi:hypothetical protein